MKPIRAVVAALLLIALLAVPTAAQEPERVFVTFELETEGQVPEGVSFYAIYDIGTADYPAGEGASPYAGEVLLADSDGNGTYSADADVPITSGEGGNPDPEFVNATVYAFVQRTGGSDELIGEVERVHPEDGDVFTASITFEAPVEDEVDAGDDDQQEMPETPNTGAGGMSGAAGLPIGNIAAGLSGLGAVVLLGFRYRR